MINHYKNGNKGGLNKIVLFDIILTFALAFFWFITYEHKLSAYILVCFSQMF